MRAPAGPRVGAVVAAQDCKGYWYAATVLAVSDDSVPQYLVTFRGFPAAQNESVPKNRIRQNLTKAQIVHLNAAIAWGNSTAGLDAARGTWAVDKITAKKGRLSDGRLSDGRCTWQGWPAIPILPMEQRSRAKSALHARANATANNILVTFMHRL